MQTIVPGPVIGPPFSEVSHAFTFPIVHFTASCTIHSSYASTLAHRDFTEYHSAIFIARTYKHVNDQKMNLTE